MTASDGRKRHDVNIFDTVSFQREYLFWVDYQDFTSTIAGLKNLADAGGTVLDAGCGDGRLAMELGKIFRRVIGFDLSPRMIAVARKRALAAGAANVHFLVGDITHPALAPSSFDLIFSSYALHETSLGASLPSLTHLLKPGGCIYAQEPEGPPNPLFPWLWYRWLGLKDAQAAMRRHGFGTAWRVFVFGQRNTWIRHQVDDGQWPLSVWRERIQQILPGAVVARPRQGTVRFLWRRPEAQPAAGPTGLPVRHSGEQDAAAPRTRVLRDYPKAAPLDHVPFPREALQGSVVARFERMARDFAARPALRTSARQWSYAELDASANRIARGILKRGGVSPVALLMDQDDPAVPALLGVLKTGRPYVFLDPDDSAGRWEDVLQATGAEQLVAPAARMPLLAAVRAGSCAVLEYEDLDGGSLSEDPGLEIGPEALAAIFFTSGSTGRPKGVLRDHGQFLHSVWLNTNSYFVSPSDRQSLLYFPGFTASVPNIFDTILNGATICSANPRRMTPGDLLDWTRRERVTHFNPPVGLWRSLLEAETTELPWPDLRLVTLGGQVIYGHDLRLFQATFGAGAVLHLGLAMTEAGAVTQAYADHSVVAEDGPLPVGYAVDDKDVAIIDAEGRPLGAGEAGRIAVTSAYLSSGYWMDEARTVRHFRPVGEGGRLKTFLTGDRGLLQADGCLEYFGRDDSVVKIRGYRVDTAAVETVLSSHPGILTAVVTAGAWRGGERALAAYVVTRGDEPVGSQDVRAYVTERLPAYMAPDHVVFLESFPLTPSGKVDRLALPAPGRSRPALNTPFAAPRSVLESRLSCIWKELLEVDDVGVDDDFFELGGDSLLAMRMALAVETALGRPVPSDFFRHSTVASLSRALGDENAAAVPAAAAGAATGREGGPHTRPRAMRRFLSAGPLLGGLCLPYGPGVRLQGWALGNPLLRRRYADWLAVMHAWAEELGVSTHSRELAAVCLLANTWRAWRAKALENPGVIGSWLRISDPHRYLSKPSTAGGVVLAVPHAGSIGGVLLCISGRSGRETAFVSNDAGLGYDDGSAQWRNLQTRSRAEMMLRAQGVLQRGGAVSISPDGLQGQRTVDAQFLGRRRPFQLGAAELAVTTGAAFVPVFVRFDVEGRVWVDVAEALKGHGHTPQERIAEMTLGYAREYSARWPQFFASMDWKHLKYNFDLPRS